MESCVGLTGLLTRFRVFSSRVITYNCAICRRLSPSAAGWCRTARDDTRRSASLDNICLQLFFMQWQTHNLLNAVTLLTKHNFLNNDQNDCSFDAKTLSYLSLNYSFNRRIPSTDSLDCSLLPDFKLSLESVQV